MATVAVAGGAYREICSEPRSHQLFGSGLRGAALLAALGQDVQLYTYSPADQDIGLQSIASSLGFGLKWLESAQQFSFYYVHGLATPSIIPAPQSINQSQPHSIDSEIVLRFGMLEGEAIVKGEKVVYDPQSPSNPRAFGENGSTARRLAIVANQREAINLSEGLDLERAAQFIREKQKAEVVVIKRGARGALVTTEKATAKIPAFKTTNVWPIGSGDIFSAYFTHYWAVEEKGPIEAAAQASLGTANYCNTQVIPSRIVPIAPNFQAVGSSLRKHTKKYDVYLAGPFFTMAERWLIEEARAALINMDLKVFSPLHDVGHGNAAQVVPADITALEDSALLFAVVDGLDAGTLFEIGYARANSVPVVAFVENEIKDDLKMLEGTNCLICDDFVSAIYHTVWSMPQA